MRTSKHGSRISLISDISDALADKIPGIEDANLDEAVNAVIDKVREHIKFNFDSSTIEEDIVE